MPTSSNPGISSIDHELMRKLFSELVAPGNVAQRAKNIDPDFIRDVIDKPEYKKLNLGEQEVDAVIRILDSMKQSKNKFSRDDVTISNAKLNGIENFINNALITFTIWFALSTSYGGLRGWLKSTKPDAIAENNVYNAKENIGFNAYFSAIIEAVAKLTIYTITPATSAVKGYFNQYVKDTFLQKTLQDKDLINGLKDKIAVLISATTESYIENLSNYKKKETNVQNKDFINKIENKIDGSILLSAFKDKPQVIISILKRLSTNAWEDFINGIIENNPIIKHSQGSDALITSIETAVAVAVAEGFISLPGILSSKDNINNVINIGVIEGNNALLSLNNVKSSYLDTFNKTFTKANVYSFMTDIIGRMTGRVAFTAAAGSTMHDLGKKFNEGDAASGHYLALLAGTRSMCMQTGKMVSELVTGEIIQNRTLKLDVKKVRSKMENVKEKMKIYLNTNTKINNLAFQDIYMAILNEENPSDSTILQQNFLVALANAMMVQEKMIDRIDEAKTPEDVAKIFEEIQQVEQENTKLMELAMYYMGVQNKEQSNENHFVIDLDGIHDDDKTKTKTNQIAIKEEEGITKKGKENDDRSFIHGQPNSQTTAL